jgi:branched-chain amino acid transport system permease protein
MQNETQKPAFELPVWVWYLVGLGLAIALPYLPFMNRPRTSVAVLVGIYIILGLSLNVIVGYAGLFQLGHAAFYGLGAYTAAILNLHFGIPILLLLPVSGLVAGLAAFLLSKPILHLRGDYLCIVTIAFGEVFRIAMRNNIFGLTGGPNGLSGIARPALPVIGEFTSDPRPYYFLVLFFIVVTLIGMRRLEDSRLGRAWLYVREDELAAEAMGIDTTAAKLAAFVIGSAWAGVAGVLYASRFRVIAPENFSFLESVIMFCIVVLGGSGSVPGVLVGTAGMVLLPEVLREAFPALLEWRDGLMGVAMVVMMILRPAGLLPSRRVARELEVEQELAPASQSSA